MPERIPKSIAKRVVFRAIASSDHLSPATGKTIAITISKNGGAFGNPAAGATNATEISSGFYYFDLGTGDTGTGGPLAWRGAGTGVDDIGDVYEVVNATNAGFTALPDAAAGASGGALINGSNSGTVTLAALTVTGALTISDGIAVSAATSNRSGVTIAGNGSGHALSLTPGATGNGLKAIGGATSGDAVVIQGTAGNSRGMLIQGQGSNDGLEVTGGATGIGVDINGGASSGAGVTINATAAGAALSVRNDSGIGVSLGSGDDVGLSISGDTNGVEIVGGSSNGVGHAVFLFGGYTSGSALAIEANGSSPAVELVSEDGNSIDSTISGAGAPLDQAFVDQLLDAPVNSEWTVREALDRIDVEVSSVSAGGGLTAADIWTYGTRTLTAIDEDSTTLDLDATIRAAVGLAGANLDSQLGALPTAAENAAELLDTPVNSEWTVQQALDRVDVEVSSVSGGGGATAADIADAVLDEALSGHSTAGSLGKAIADTLADTNELQADWADGGRLDNILDARASQASVDTVDAVADAIKLKTDNLPIDPADASDVDDAINSVLSAISGLSIPTTAQIFAAVLQTQITESYRTNGAAPTLAQAMCELLAHHGEAVNSGTTKTLRKFDHSTVAATFSYDDADNPSSVTRAS